MDFFRDYVVINGVEYVCKYSQSKVLIPCSGSHCYCPIVSCGDDIVVNDFEAKVVNVQIIDSFGFGGKKKIFEIRIQN